MLRPLSLAFTLLLCAACTTAPPPPAPDEIVTRLLGSHFHGVVLTRASRTGPVLVRTFGLARAEPAQATRADHLYQIGSVSKWISAVAVLRLVDQGKLQLDVPIGQYVPGLPSATGTTVTLRHLLSNTAGIPNGVQQAYKLDPGIATLPLDHRQASLRFASAPLAFVPGSGWDYSPTTWIVVAAVIEQAAGQPYERAITDLVLAPAGLRSTAVPGAPFRDMPGAALAYRNRLPWELAMTPHIPFVAASGTLYSTAADLAQLAYTVYDTDLLSPGAKAELWRIVVPAQEYALGGRVRQLSVGGRARTVAWQTGATGGFKTVLAYVPDSGQTVVILNNTDLSQGELARAAEALLGQLP